jgi:hypothetical protein
MVQMRADRGPVPFRVTLRVLEGVGSLRHRRAAKVLRRALLAAAERLGVRIVHFAAFPDRLELVCEVDGAGSLTRAMTGVSVRIARGLNGALERRGQVLAGRYQAKELTTLAEVAELFGRLAPPPGPPRRRERRARVNPMATVVEHPLAEPRSRLLRDAARLVLARRALA